MSDTENVNRIIDKFFQNPGVDDVEYRTGRYPFITWSYALVKRWGMIPRDGGKRALDYIKAEAGDDTRMNVIDALRAFHVADWHVTPGTMKQFMRMENDYDHVPPKVQEGDLEEANWRRMEQQQDRLNPLHPSRRGRLFVPPGGGKYGNYGEPS